jgi:glycosyltransferase involved in cell wall biosynthesis
VQSGAERQALEQGAELVRRGHVVHVLTRALPDAPRDERVRGLHVHRWVARRTWGPLFGLKFVADVVGALRRLRPQFDLVHTHQALWEAVAVGVARPWLRGAPTLVQPASSGYFGEAEELLRTRGAGLLRRLAVRNTALAAISADIARQWRALGVPDERIIRMASGVDTSRFHPGSSTLEDRLPPRPRVVFTGRLHPQKNLDMLIEAWAAVRGRGAANLLIVGEGPEHTALQAQAEQLGVAGSVHLLGAVADPAEILRAADVFVLPSVAEGMSNSLLEAMATGLPCLASAIGGNDDLLAGHGAGLLLDPRDPGAWAEAITGILRDPDRARTLGRAALGRVRAEYALPRVMDRYEHLYRRLLGRSDS